MEFTQTNGVLMFKQGAVTAPVRGGAPGEIFVGTQRMFTRTEDGKVMYVYTGSRALARQP
jgi:hypothetical protein